MPDNNNAPLRLPRPLEQMSDDEVDELFSGPKPDKAEQLGATMTAVGRVIPLPADALHEFETILDETRSNQ